MLEGGLGKVREDCVLRRAYCVTDGGNWGYGKVIRFARCFAHLEWVPGPRVRGDQAGGLGGCSPSGARGPRAYSVGKEPGGVGWRVGAESPLQGLTQTEGQRSQQKWADCGGDGRGASWRSWRRERYSAGVRIHFCGRNSYLRSPSYVRQAQMRKPRANACAKTRRGQGHPPRVFACPGAAC
jgi:hypothetical protein